MSNPVPPSVLLQALIGPPVSLTVNVRVACAGWATASPASAIPHANAPLKPIMGALMSLGPSCGGKAKRGGISAPLQPVAPAGA